MTLVDTTGSDPGKVRQNDAGSPECGDQLLLRSGTELLMEAAAVLPDPVGGNAGNAQPDVGQELADCQTLLQ